MYYAHVDGGVLCNSMCNQCSGLFICIIDYLYVLCMILMILSCVLCMTLKVFIYVYYGLFACTNLVDVISLFFTVFSVHLPNFDKNRLVSGKNRPELATPVFGKTVRFIGQTGRFIGEINRISVFPVFTVPPSSSVRFGRIFLIFADFYQNFQKPTGSVRSGFPCSTEFLNTIFCSAGLEKDRHFTIATTHL
jgi:hypothetical protein